MAEDFSELYNFLFNTPGKALLDEENQKERFVPDVSEIMQRTHPMIGVVAMSMALYEEEEAYNMAFLGLIQTARQVAESVAKNITIEMIEYVLEEKDR